MMDCTNDYTAHYRWEWFCREEWRHSFRERKQHSSGAFVGLVKEREMDGQPSLDCSCGLGLKTIVMREAGLNVQGSDACGFAVEHARSFAEEEGHSDIPYFVSSWAELPQKTRTRYSAIFNDALSWIGSTTEMEQSLKGLHDSLVPGGVLAYMGALPGTDVDQEDILEQEWKKRTSDGTHRLGIGASDGRSSVQEIVCFEKGPDYIDEHHLYAVEENGTRRLETWCLRCTVQWSWPRMEKLLGEAGFVRFSTKEFVAADGTPFHLVVAERD